MTRLLCLTAIWAFLANGVALAAESDEIRNVYFPPVPEMWSQRIEGLSIIYSAPLADDGGKSPTEIKLTYTRRTEGRDALGMIKNYVKTRHCSTERQLGVGFYITSCKDLNTDAIFVGEPDNLYEIEVSGLYTREAKALVSRYLSDIIRGKRTFADRSIGDKVNN